MQPCLISILDPSTDRASTLRKGLASVSGVQDIETFQDKEALLETMANRGENGGVVPDLVILGGPGDKDGLTRVIRGHAPDAVLVHVDEDADASGYTAGADIVAEEPSSRGDLRRIGIRLAEMLECPPAALHWSMPMDANVDLAATEGVEAAMQAEE